jgi:alpha-L-rhamnosidase
MDNYGVLKLYEKVADDMEEAQLSNGLVPGIAPEYVAFVDAKGDSTNFRDSPEWAAPASWPPGRPISSTATSRC